MPKNSTPGFYATGAEGNLVLTTSFQVLTTGQTEDSDLVVCNAINNSGTAVTVTFGDDAGNIIGVLNLPASAGISASQPPLNCLQAGFGMGGLELDGKGGFLYYLPAGKDIQVRCSSVAGGDKNIFWKRKDY